MKYIVFIYIVFNALVSLGQDSLNYSPSRAWNLCQDPSKVLFSSRSGFLCTGNQSKLYYILQPMSDFQAGVNGTVAFRGYANSGTTSTILLTYKLYGPFNPNDDYATWIENNGVAPVEMNGTASAVQNLSGFLVGGKHYVLEVTAMACSGRIAFTYENFKHNCKPGIQCENCIPKFQPTQGQYVVTGWVKEDGGEAKTSYTNCKMKVVIDNTSTDIPVSGQIIDGWQRMEKVVSASSSGSFAIELSSADGECYFDDIRVIPFDGSMVSYVYDPLTMKVIAELDERNYAKIYEYDEEGKLVRVKKETEKGVMTIQENRENSSVNGGY